MANRIDPFVIQWPRKWMADNEIRPVIEYLNRFLHDLYRVTDGGEAIETTIVAQVDTDGLFGLFGRIASLEFRNIVPTAVDYTTIGSDIVICTDALTVTLNDEPEDQEMVTIKRTAGLVVVDGNGKLIDGESSWRLNVKLWGLDAIYLVETDSWHKV